ncbi:MAG: D-2-hydroxyacid dehydrogenase [Anaerolineales bacterium]|nr:D-2-hydroxyacid dehydrogenase [Anaerolineales bacterium]
MNVLLLAFTPGTLSEEQLDQVRAAAPDMEVVVTQDEREVERVLDRVEIVAGRLPRKLLAKAGALRWMQQWGAGADWLMRFPEAAGMPFTLTNASGVHAVPISEHILALMLAFARQLPRAFRDQERQHWTPHEEPRNRVFELAGSTVVLIGVGAIGERTAEIASALGMRVLGVRRAPQIGAPGVTAMAGPDQLLDLLPEADFVVLTAPLTHETKGMIGARELGVMKRTAIIINIGRGGTIDEPALIAALQEGRIAGAGLDVFETEPLPSSSPLWAMDNVIITAHYAGLTPRYDERALGIFLDNLRRYRAGEPLRNVVDKELGY